MTQQNYAGPRPGDDTPDRPALDEVPPYGEPGGGMRKIFTVVAIIAAGAVCIYIAVRFWRTVAGLVARLVVGFTTATTVDPSVVYDREVIMVPLNLPAVGPVWHVRFYDGVYQQLTDKDLAVVLDLDDPQADMKLASLALNLAAEVDRRDGQRCFSPRLELVNGAGRVVREWSAR